jgi:copper chaperone NosL
MSRFARVLTAIAAVALAGLFYFPLWRVQLVAPQYPEGLGMRIAINSVKGATPNDLDNINGLNHYIGMQRITPEAIPELRIMPWIVGLIILTGLIVAVAGRKRGLYAWFAGFTLIGAVGLVDFWHWEYDYGHHLDFEHAIIKIPGMTYQPPLIGVKQLLNFTAVSWPDVGGWLAFSSLALAALAVVVALRSRDTRAAILLGGTSVV